MAAPTIASKTLGVPTQKKSPSEGSSKACAQPGIAILSFKVRWLAPRSGGAKVRTCCMIMVDSVDCRFNIPKHSSHRFYVYIRIYNSDMSCVILLFSSSSLCQHSYAAQLLEQ